MGAVRVGPGRGPTSSPPERPIERLGLDVTGAVQGVGFRPFVFRLASELGLTGRVRNDARGASIEIEGPRSILDLFCERLPAELPPPAALLSTHTQWLEVAGYRDFSIEESDVAGERSAVILPEIATCAECLSEILDPADRRYRYPFTNCTHCGPRFSILESLPYDRPNTSMRIFEMCALCRREYGDPRNRRFHAQPNACPGCGPQLGLLDRNGETLAVRDEALLAAARALLAGRILAVKGLGGFHLMALGSNGWSVRALRQRKGRYGKPLALMVRDLDQAREICVVSEEAAALLSSPQAPIVLLPRRRGARIAPEVAPRNPYLGVMLPYTPLHHLLLREVGAPVVATSGNLRDEPICIDNIEGLARLGHIADLFLVHDRPIVRHVDDSVFASSGAGVQPVRRARGYAPLPITVERELPPILAVGAHLKNVVAVSVGRSVFLSQHIGDMETPQAMAAFERVLRDFLDLYGVRPAVVACDLHPGYPSTEWLERVRTGFGGEERDRKADGWRRMIREARLGRVQHHHAHLASCLADNGVTGPALGVTWDGTGYGPDGSVWGGEFLVGSAAGYRRVASLRPFRLPGGDAAVHEPRRVALALLWELIGEAALERRELAPVAGLTEAETRVFARMLERGFCAPLTSSAGRLFDGVAALLDLHQRVGFEGEAAMALEFCADPMVRAAYPIHVVSPQAPEGDDRERVPLHLDWRPLIAAILQDLARKVEPAVIAARFHNALAQGIVAIARHADEPIVALTGGCFQNRLLTERTKTQLERAGFKVLLHRRVPTNDGGISLGQVAVAAAGLEARR